MDTRIKPAYDDLNLPLPSDQLIDPRSLSRRKRGQNYRLGRAGIGGVGVGFHIRRFGLAGFRHCHRGRGRNSRYTHRKRSFCFVPTVRRLRPRLYESEPPIARDRGQSGRMVNGKSPISLKRLRSRLALPRSCRRRPGLAYSSLPREIAIDASVFVLLQRISRRR
jgi:hypothetical protein